MELKDLLREVLKRLNLRRDIRIRVKPLKGKVASISHRSGTIYLNKRCLEVLTEEEIKFVLAHELLHLKHGKFHTLDFERELIGLFGRDLTPSINRKMLMKTPEGGFFNTFQK